MTESIDTSSPYDSPQESETLTPLDVVLVAVHHRRTIGITTTVILVLGLLIAISTPSSYTASAKVVREEESKNVSGLAGGIGMAALRGLGISFGGSSTGLTAETYPDILLSREVRLAVVRSPFYFRELDTTMSLVDFFERGPSLFGRVKKGLFAVTIGLPGTIKRLFIGKGTEPVQIISGDEILFITKSEEESIEKVLDLVSVSIDRATGLMIINTIAHDPYLSVQLANTFIKHLSSRVRDVHSQRVMHSLTFIRERFYEAKIELEAAEEELARFMDQNRDPTTAKLRTEVERLQRQVSFKTQLSSDLQAQLMQAEIDYKRSEIVITVLEAPALPREPSGPRRKVIVFSALLLGLFLGAGLAMVKAFFHQLQENPEEQPKLAEIRETLVLDGGLKNWLIAPLRLLGKKRKITNT